ncbi:MAG TPA: S-methyl-5'-thioadenosine phosphorylase [Dissulfurispiraceae bacterium]|nr:S-methyl-5'-thioadenosine phosphorylase [Dissulfurispiraceae bacterium]
MVIGVIGGSGLYEVDGLSISKEVSLLTPFGEPSSTYRIGKIGNIELAFLPRHGTPHSIPPHKVNYRANIWGFKSLGVNRIISVNAVGGINRDLPPGTIVLQDQIIDRTSGRQQTFYDSDKVVHIDFTDPYCNEMRELCIAAAAESSIAVQNSATYICVNGPRLETAAEIRFFADNGADIVGMTAMPETSLARELEICVLGVSVVTNYAAGIVAAHKLTAKEVVEKMKDSTALIKRLLSALVPKLPEARSCPCSNALKDAGL